MQESGMSRKKVVKARNNKPRVVTIEKLVRELEIHQRELEAQNKELRRAQSALESSRNRYSALYEFAPVAYFTFSRGGLVLDVNLKGTKLLGIDRASLLKTPFSIHLKEESRSAFFNYLKRLFKEGRPERCEMQLRGGSGALIAVRIESTVVNDREQGRVSRSVLIDLEDRRRADEALRESEEKYRLLFENNPHPMWVFDPESLAFLAVNAAAIHHYGYSREEFLSMTIKDIRPPEEISSLLEGLVNLPGRFVHTGVWRHRKKDGKVIDVESTGQRISFSGRTAQLVVAKNVTERNRAESALRQSERRFRALIENSSDAIALLNASGKIFYASPSNLRIFGYVPEKLIGKTALELIHPEDRERMKRLFSDLAQQPEGEAMAELRFQHKSGAWRWVEGIGSNLLREPGVHAIVVNYRDITERKRAEEALRKSEERFQLVTRATNDAIWDWDLVTNALSWSGSFKTMFGYKPEQIIPSFEWWRSRLHPEDRNRICMGLQSVIDHGEQFWSDEYRFCQGDGSYATILDRGYIVHDRQGKPIRMIGAMMDISELKRAEEAIQAMNEALQEKNLRIEEASRARTRFFSYMSHELKTPINSVVGFTQLLRNGTYGALTSGQAEAVGRINNNARELIHLITNILDLAKLETGKIGLQAVEVNLRELVEKVLFNFEPLLKEKGLRFRKEIDPDFPERFLTDPMQMRSILMNLLSNAVKFTEQGEIRLRLERLTQGGVALQVSDTGVGISEEYLGRIFEEYEQRGVAREAKGNYTGGSGLGLAIVKKMVDLLNGRIEVSSTPGQGSVFTIFIPEASTAT